MLNSGYNIARQKAPLKASTLLCLTFLVLGMVFSLFAAAPVSAQGVILTVNTKQVTMGGTFAISGTGFGSGEKISIWVTDPNAKAYTVGFLYADSNGTFNQFTNTDFPVTTPPGTWTVTVKGLTSLTTASDTFSVVDPTIKGAGLMVGDIVIAGFSGANWYKGERVQVWVTDPTTQKVYGSNDTYAWADTQGNIPASPGLVIFFSGKPGTYYITIYGRTSQVTKIVPFTVS